MQLKVGGRECKHETKGTPPDRGLARTCTTMPSHVSPTSPQARVSEGT